MLWVVVALSGCGWLLEVPEEQIPVRAPETTGNRVANQRGEDAAYKDPTVKAKLSTELNTGEGLAEDGSGTEGGGTTTAKPRWDPVSRPQEPKEEKPFVFQTATGTRINNTGAGDDSYSAYPTASELGITEAKRQEMIKGGELVRRR